MLFKYVEILSSFNSKLQLKDTESAITIKLIDLLTKLGGFYIHGNIGSRVLKNRMWWWNKI